MKISYEDGQYHLEGPRFLKAKEANASLSELHIAALLDLEESILNWVKHTTSEGGCPPSDLAERIMNNHWIKKVAAQWVK